MFTNGHRSSSAPSQARFSLTLLFVLAGLLSLPAPAASIHGGVFEDRNGNALWDPDEPGLPGVRVSDGVKLQTTDAEGRYSLEVTEDCTLFVIKPRGFRTALGSDFLPKFYYHHIQTGIPNTSDSSLAFEGLAPTGPAPASVDFPLYPQEEPETFTVLLTADPQPYTTQELLWYGRDTIAEIATLKPAFALALGDLVGDNLRLFEPLVETNALTGFPWYMVIGNHDHDLGAKNDREADGAYRRVFGPTNYAFQYAGTHFLVFDNIDWLGKSPDKQKASYQARLTDIQLQFAAGYLATVPAEELVLVCTHIPLVYRQEGKEPWLTPQTPRLLQLLSGHAHTLSLSGHMHITYSEYLGAESGYTPQAGTRHLHQSVPAASGSWYTGPLDQDGLPVTLQRDGTPHGYLVLEVKGNTYTLRFKGLRRSAEEQVRIYAPEVIADACAPGQVTVNFYLGNEACTVSYRLDGQGAWLTMKQYLGLDPAYLALQQRTEPQASTFGYPKLPKPEATPHLWTAPLPQGLKPGMHLVEVQALDAYGQTFSAQTPVRVLGPNSPWIQLDETSSRRK